MLTEMQYFVFNVNDYCKENSYAIFAVRFF